MAENSKIEWCDHTFNPWIGCTKISPGCENCYAERDFGPKSRHPMGAWGAGKERHRTSESNWKNPLAWIRKAQRENRRVTVFCGSLCDVFDEEVPKQWRVDLLKMIVGTSHALNWLLLTKRPEKMRNFFRDECIQETLWLSSLSEAEFMENIRLGVTVCNQSEADEKIPVLLDTPAAGRFVSVEPMLGPVDLTKIRYDTPDELPGRRRWYLDAVVGCISPAEKIPGCTVGRSGCTKLDWVICGGETGPNARPVHPDWVRSLRDQCAEGKDVGNDIPFFFKQWGEYGPSAENMMTGEPAFRMFDSESRWVNKASSWVRPGDVCIDAIGRICRCGDDFAKASYPVAVMRRIGKDKAGCLLDGKEYKEFPEGLK